MLIIWCQAANQIQVTTLTEWRTLDEKLSWSQVWNWTFILLMNKCSKYLCHWHWLCPILQYKKPPPLQRGRQTSRRSSSASRPDSKGDLSCRHPFSFKHDSNHIQTVFQPSTVEPACKVSVLSNENCPYKRADLISGLLISIRVLWLGPVKNWPYKRVDLTSEDHTCGLDCIFKSGKNVS